MVGTAEVLELAEGLVFELLDSHEIILALNCFAVIFSRVA